MVGILGVLILCVGLFFYLRALAHTTGDLLDKTGTRHSRRRAAFILAILVAVPAYAAIKISHTPPAKAIAKQLEITDAAGLLTVHSIAMAAPVYENGEGFLEKHYFSDLLVEVTNDSDQDAYLGVECYADAGSLGFYSPGAGVSGESLTVPAQWSGILRYKVRHLRFVHGGHLSVTLATYKAPSARLGQPKVEELFKDSFDMVAD